MRIFISYCSADQPIKDVLFTLLKQKIDFDSYDIRVVSMDTDCAGDWAEWMISAVKSCDIVIPLLTANSMYVREGDGRKRVFEETRTARDTDKVLVPFATCTIPDEMIAHIGSYSVSKTLDEVVDKVRIILENQNSDDKYTLRESASLSAFRSAQTNKNFVGRDVEISWLDKTLHNHNVAILKGEGGIGKTTLAEYYYQCHKGDYVGAYIVDASGGIRDCITNMPFKTSHIQDEDERYAENKKYLSMLDEKTIFILDNCDVVIDGEDLDDIIDRTRCKFIITSRKGDDGRAVVESYNVGRMDNDDLLALVRRYNPDIEEQNGLSKEEVDKKLIELFKLVDGHTLTIEMASAIMESAWVSIDEIMGSLLECEETARTRKFKGEETIMANLGALYDFAKLTEEQKRVLNFLCYICPSVGIELGEIRKILELKNVNAIKSLVNDTFVRRDEHSSRLSMHPLFADVYYKKEKPDNTPEAEMVKEYIGSIDIAQVDAELAKKYIGLVEYIIEKRAQGCDDGDRRNLDLLLVLAYFTLGKFHVAEKILDTRYAEFERMTKQEQIENEAWAEYNFMTSVCMKIGDFERGLECGHHAKALIEEFCGEDYVMAERAQANNNLACIYREIGNFQLACEYFEEAKEEYETLLEVDDEDSELYAYSLATVYTSLGASYIEMGETERALEFCQKGVDMYLEIFGGDETHSRLAMCYNNLGNAYSRIGEHGEALKYVEKATEIMEREYGDEPHPDLALMYNNVGQELVQMGDIDKAIPWLQKSLDMLYEVYENEPIPLFATIYSNLAECYRMKERYEIALENYKNAIDVAEIAYEDYPEHPILATLYSNIALLYDAIGEYDLALKYVIDAIVIYEAISESVPADAMLLAVYNQARLVCFHAKIYKSAIEYLEKYLEIYKRTSQLDARIDEKLARDYYDLAYYYRLDGNFDKCYEAAEQSISIFIAINKEVKPCEVMVARLGEELGWASRSRKDFRNQNRWYKLAFDSYGREFKSYDNKEALRCAFYFAESIIYYAKYENALEWFNYVEALHQKLEVQTFLRGTYNALVFVHGKLGNDDKAEYYKKKLEEANGN